MRYKILFISSWFPSKIEPTNGNFVQRHAEAVSLLHDVEILHAVGDSSQTERYLFDDKSVNGIRTLMIYYKNSANPALNFYRRMRSYQIGFKKLDRPDLVHANVLQKSMVFAVYLKSKFKIPFIVSEHWSGFLNINRSKLSKSQVFIAKQIAEKADYLVPVSQYLKNDLKDLGFTNQLQVVENVVDTNLFKVKKTASNHFTFLHISNLVQLKNPESIIRAAVTLAKEFSDFKLQIGGDGDIDQLNILIKDNNAEHYIKSFGMLTSAEVAEKMRKSNCFVLFSDYENFPCVLLESLSSGTPAIATKVGGIPEIINENNGVLIGNSDEELVEAMRKVLQKNLTFNEPNILHEYVENRYSMNVIAQKFDAIYQKILAKN